MAELMAASETPETVLWQHLAAEQVGMLGEVGNTLPLQPMFHHADQSARKLRFFTSRRTVFFEFIGLGVMGHYTIMSRSRDFYASMSGALTEDLDRAALNKLWSPTVAAWFENDINNPDIALVSLLLQSAAIWATGGEAAGFSYSADPAEISRHGVHRTISFPPKDMTH